MIWLDVTGASLSLVSTYHFTKGRHSAWVIGMLAIFLNIALYWQKRIYGHVFLEAIYFIIMCIGLFKWKNEQKLKTYKLTPMQAGYCAFIAISAFIGYFFILVHFTNSQMPYWDASTTILCLFAQGLMIYKILLCWVIWFVVDLMIAILQWRNDMPFHSLVTLSYLGLAISGYIHWKKHLCHVTLDKSSFFPFLFKKSSTSIIGNALENK